MIKYITRFMIYLHSELGLGMSCYAARGTLMPNFMHKLCSNAIKEKVLGQGDIVFEAGEVRLSVTLTRL